jgi:hypothetical protein
MHEVLRGHSLTAWQAVAGGEPNPLKDSLGSDPELLSILPKEEIRQATETGQYLGVAQKRALALADRIDNIIER